MNSHNFSEHSTRSFREHLNLRIIFEEKKCISWYKLNFLRNFRKSLASNSVRESIYMECWPKARNSQITNVPWMSSTPIGFHTILLAIILFAGPLFKKQVLDGIMYRGTAPLSRKEVFRCPLSTSSFLKRFSHRILFYCNDFLILFLRFFVGVPANPSINYFIIRE